MALITKVEKSKLLDILKKNRDEHHAIFEEALEGYKKAAVKELTHRIDKISKGKPFNLYIGLQQPVDKTDEYNSVIEMLEMSEDDIISLTQQEFQQYVKDDWHWKNQFLTANSYYSTTAATQLRDTDEDY